MVISASPMGAVLEPTPASATQQQTWRLSSLYGELGEINYDSGQSPHRRQRALRQYQDTLSIATPAALSRHLCGVAIQQDRLSREYEAGYIITRAQHTALTKASCTLTASASRLDQTHPIAEALLPFCHCAPLGDRTMLTATQIVLGLTSSQATPPTLQSSIRDCFLDLQSYLAAVDYE